MKKFIPVTPLEEQASIIGNETEVVRGSRQRTLSKTPIPEDSKENGTCRQAPLKALSQREMDSLFAPESSDEDSNGGSIAPLEALSQEDLFFQPESSSDDSEVLSVKKDRKALRVQKEQQKEIEYSLLLDKKNNDFYDHSSNMEFYGKDFAEIGKKRFRQLMKMGAQKKQEEEEGKKNRVVTVFYYEKGKKVSMGSLDLQTFLTYKCFLGVFEKIYPNQKFLLSYSYPDGPENQLYNLSIPEWHSFSPSIIYVRIM